MERWRTNYAPRTAYKMRSEFRRFLEQLEQYGAPKDCRQLLARLRRPGPKTAVVSHDELHKLIAAAEPWLRCFILLCSSLALRFSEALAVSPHMYDATSKSITVPTKGYQSHTLPVPEQLAQMFELAPNPEDTMTPYIFKLKGQVTDPDTVRRAFERLRKRLGIPEDITPHSLRRTAANVMYDLTQDVRAVQQLLGHSDLSTTAYYLAHRDPEKLRPLVAQLEQWHHFPQGGKPQ